MRMLVLCMLTLQCARGNILVLNGLHATGNEATVVGKQFVDPFGVLPPRPVHNFAATMYSDPSQSDRRQSSLFAGASCVYNNTDFYGFGGRELHGAGCHSHGFRYNISSGNFTAMEYPVPVCYQTLTCWPKFGVLVGCGGYTVRPQSNVTKVYNTCYMQDVISSNWTQLPQKMAKPLYKHAAAVMNDRLYLMGGYNGPPGYNTLASKETYALRSPDAYWVTVGSMSVHRAGQAVAVLHWNWMIVCGGVDKGDAEPWVHAHCALDTCEQFATDRAGLLGTWTTIEGNLSTGRSHFSFMQFNGWLFAIGGYTDPQYPMTPTVEYMQYNVTASKAYWQESPLSLPTAVAHAHCVPQELQPVGTDRRYGDLVFVYLLEEAKLRTAVDLAQSLASHYDLGPYRTRVAAMRSFWYGVTLGQPLTETAGYCDTVRRLADVDAYVGDAGGACALDPCLPNLAAALKSLSSDPAAGVAIQPGLLQAESPAGRRKGIVFVVDQTLVHIAGPIPLYDSPDIALLVLSNENGTYDNWELLLKRFNAIAHPKTVLALKCGTSLDIANLTSNGSSLHDIVPGVRIEPRLHECYPQPQPNPPPEQGESPLLYVLGIFTLLLTAGFIVLSLWCKHNNILHKRNIRRIMHKVLRGGDSDEWQLDWAHVSLDYNVCRRRGATSSVLLGTMDTRRVLSARRLAALAAATPMFAQETVGVVVKMMQSPTDGVKLRREFDALRRLQTGTGSEHIVVLLGRITSNTPVHGCIVTMHCDAGDLSTALVRRKRRIENGVDDLFKRPNEDFVNVAWQCAKACAYIATAGCVHNGIAARNVFIDHRLTVCLGDFGLCSFNDCTEQQVQQLYTAMSRSLRWCAPELLCNAQCTGTHASDVWAFGILLFELYTFGAVPYANMTQEDIVSRVKRTPDDCADGDVGPPDFGALRAPLASADGIRRLMLDCLCGSADRRPHFATVEARLRTALRAAGDVGDDPHSYLDVIDECDR